MMSDKKKVIEALKALEGIKKMLHEHLKDMEKQYEFVIKKDGETIILDNPPRYTGKDMK